MDLISNVVFRLREWVSEWERKGKAENEMKTQRLFITRSSWCFLFYFYKNIIFFLKNFDFFSKVPSIIKKRASKIIIFPIKIFNFFWLCLFFFLTLDDVEKKFIISNTLHTLHSLTPSYNLLPLTAMKK